MAAKGSNGTLDIVEGKLVLTHKSPVAFSKRIEKLIPLGQITSISYVRPGAVRRGYIRFSFHGGQEFKSTTHYNPAYDENAVVFSRKEEKDFLGIKTYIEQIISNNQHPKSGIRLAQNSYLVSNSDTSDVQ